MYFSYQRYDEALFEYNKALALDSDNIEIRLKIARVYSKKGYLSKAFEELRSLKSESPNYLPARMALGLLHYSQGNIIEAQSEWQMVLAKDPNYSEAQMYMQLSQSASETNIN
jgi:tetratricopeptide (TPR) repeat protein